MGKQSINQTSNQSNNQSNNQSSKQTTQTIKMETIKNAANYVAEPVQGGGAQASKEANKQVAKDGDASVGTRASAAKDAVSDKIDQSSHEGKADLHKEAAKH